jgi:hypothetical protein
MDFSIHRHLVGLLGWGISPTQIFILLAIYRLELRGRRKARKNEKGGQTEGTKNQRN